MRTATAVGLRESERMSAREAQNGTRGRGGGGGHAETQLPTSPTVDSLLP